MTVLNDRAAADVVAAMGMLPETFWETNDDACDCTYQRIGMWTNPYLAETLEVRMCCIWSKLYELFPQYVRTTPAFLNHNTGEWETEPREWDGEDEMPKAIWYRQIARKSGVRVEDARTYYQNLDYLRPKGTPRPVVEGEPPVDLIEVLFQMITGLAERVAELEGAA